MKVFLFTGPVHGSSKEVAVRRTRMTSLPLEKLAVLAACAALSAAISLFAFFCSPITTRFRFAEEEAAATLVSAGGDRGGLRSEDGACELFEGRWVWDEEYPLYESKDCRFVDEGFRCAENGRPDRLYAKWRWQPAGCDLPRFHGKGMLEKLRNRRVVFAGDSIGRNQWESLLCMLSSSSSSSSSYRAVKKSSSNKEEEEEEDSVFEVNGNPITRHKGFLVFKFRDYNCTVEYYRAPYLVRRGRPPPGSPETVRSTLRLDAMDRTASRWRDADLLVLNTGHWWNHEKTVKSGCYFQEGEEVRMEMSPQAAYERSINTLFHWIQNEVNTTKTQVVFRTYSPAHSSMKSDGGTCSGARAPDLSSSDMRWQESWAQFLKPFARGLMELDSSTDSAAAALREEVDMLNITHMTAQRRDGHQSLYYRPAAAAAAAAGGGGGGGHGSTNIHKPDCSHWCLPGVPDAWNELLHALFLRREFKLNHLY